MIKVKFIICVLLVLFYVIPEICHAGAVNGQVTSVVIRASDGLVYFTVNGIPSSKPTCATGPYWMIRNENSTAGKQQLAALLAALSNKTDVTVYGMNTCDRWGDGEDVDIVVAY